ncbi:DEAD/DEAH box helicase [Brachybacterium sp. EF45031]|uniref:DEAD/DEAH box helicase n=1 Tax=Brachybacterium sillae TaxID=2810536 RepID=UPI0025597884|nr:DEAD/DEAH box helicase [Brachybacterium sillae]MCS6711195.1 DEAD/DEAH box helicase [Brachybacterium sillae]
MPDAAPLPRIPATMITSFVGDRTASQGFAAAREGRVEHLQWEVERGLLRAAVREAVDPEAPIDEVEVHCEELDEDSVSRRFWPQEAGGVWRPLTSRCTCPEETHCVHAAALLYAADARREAEQRERPTPQWRTVLHGLLREEGPREAPVPLALRVVLEAATPQPGGAPAGRSARHAARPEDLTSGSELHAGLQPLRRGAHGGWVRAGLSWRTFEFRMPRTEFVPAQADALTRVFAAAGTERSYASGSPDLIWLSAAGAGPVWEALRGARDAGVTLLPPADFPAVALAAQADADLDLTRDDAGLLLRVRLLIAGLQEAVADPRPLGVTGAAGLDADGTLVMAPLLSPLPSSLRRLAADADGLRIAPEEEADFLAVAYPKLRDVLTVGSSDASVELPRIPPATLEATAAYTEGDRLTLTWAWHYHDPDRVVPMAPGVGGRRDRAHEEEVLARVRTVWPTAGGEDPERLSGVDTAQFTTHVLDALRAEDHVDVRITGTRHAYRELDAAPQVRVTQVPSEGRTDWFDLAFRITVDGREIPFPSLFRALASGRSRLMLEDRTFFSLDHPAFDVLRRLISEGQEMAEWEPDHQSLSRYQLDLWDDLGQIAVELETAAEFEATLRALRATDAGAGAGAGTDTGAGTAAGTTEASAIPPATLTTALRPYQLDGYRWLRTLYDLGLGGILADDMGLGKTLQTLALIAHARESADAGAAPFLVVAPTSVLPVWREEAARHIPSLRVAVLDRTTRARGSDVTAEIERADVVVTSYAVLRIDQEQLISRPWSGLVLDEAQFVKNPRSRTHQAVRQVSAPFRLAITGTPMENSLDDLWAVSSLVTPGLLGTHIGFRRRYAIPLAAGEHPERMEELRSRIRPFLLRRTKDLVVRDLPEKTELVVRVPLSPDHRALYDRVLQRERTKVLGLIESDAERSRFIVFRSLTLLRMLALDPGIVDGEAYDDVPSSKLAALMDRLDEVLADGHRVLLFSQFTSFLQRVAQELSDRGVSFAYLDGSTRDRDGAVEAFRQGELPVFLISLKAGGFGLTLTEADYVVLLDPWWNPAAENQAIDRAHRIGQDRRVMVVKLVAEDTIEEKVLALQQRKAALFDALTDDGTAFQKAMTADDIRDLLG